MIILPEQLAPLGKEQVWVCYTMIYNPSKHGGRGGYDKPPINPYHLDEGSATDPARWGTFSLCQAQKGKPCSIFYKGRQVTSTVAGVGIVLEAAGLVGVDLDNVYKIGREGGRINTQGTEGAMRICRYLRSYTELSPSGTGIHILMSGRKPGAEVCRATLNGGLEVEMYDRGRYFTVSTLVFPKSPGIEAGEDRIKGLYDFLVRKRLERASPSVARCDTGGSGERLTPGEDDQRLWDRMFASKNGGKIHALFIGDLSEYDGDDSRADLALCNFLAHWTNLDSNRIDRMFRETALYRPKWERADYRERTIRLAMNGKTPYHEYTTEERRQYAKDKAEEEARSAGRYS